jgi:hypothetical protein
VGRDVVFGAGQYAPGTDAGRQLIAHELTHTVQQGAVGDAALAASPVGGAITVDREAEAEAERTAAGVSAGRPAANVGIGTSGPALQRQTHSTPSPSVRSPAFEELVTQVSTVQAGLVGRPLSGGEERLARSVFGASIDYSRVRLIPTGIVEYTTVANTIRVPEDFTIADEYMAQTLIHELTHVWQYQHGGGAYISDSLCHQVAAWAATGSRDAAYDLAGVVRPGRRFSDYTAEQQAMIVETYYSDPAKRTDPVYQALMEEVRQRPPAPPVARQRLIYEEALFGPTNDSRRDDLPHDPDRPQIMPFFRIDF